MTSAQLTETECYVRSIRNAVTRKYADDYRTYINNKWAGALPPVRGIGLSYTAAHAVRIRLAAILGCSV